MKKRQWLLAGFIGVCLLVLLGYRLYDSSVTDRKAPVITIEEGELAVSVYDPETALMQGVSAMDDRDGDVTGSIIIESIGNITDDAVVTVTYAAFDQAGNVSKQTRKIQYLDYVKPRFTLSAPLAFGYGSYYNIVDQIGAVDDLDGDITYRVKVTSLNSEFVSAPGLYDLLLQVTNSLGDVESMIVQAEIYPAGSYNAKLELTDYMIYLPQGTPFDPEDYLKSFTYYVNTVDLTEEVPSDFQLDMSGRVQVNVPGIYSVEYTLRHTQGYQTYSGYSKLIVVVEG